MARPPAGTILGKDGVRRCGFAGTDPLYTRYHDREWGFPVRSDRRLFEKICLEGFQSGLAWITILRKRENFRAAFRNFEIEAVARMNARSVSRLLQDAGIVRHRGKIESTLNNARRSRELIREYGSLAAFCWSFEPDPSQRPRRVTPQALAKLTQTSESVALSKALKERGWTFVGPTNCYAFMQAMGLVNDHLDGCASRSEVEAARARFRPPRLGSDAILRRR
ncbi:MAG: DNA-3-methyladenine glycosylase I [Myxococcota bacterium]